MLLNSSIAETYPTSFLRIGHSNNPVDDDAITIVVDITLDDDDDDDDDLLLLLLLLGMLLDFGRVTAEV